MTAVPEGNKGRLDSPTCDKNTSPAGVVIEGVQYPVPDEAQPGDTVRWTVTAGVVSVEVNPANDHYVTQQDLQGE